MRSIAMSRRRTSTGETRRSFGSIRIGMQPVFSRGRRNRGTACSRPSMLVQCVCACVRVWHQCCWLGLVELGDQGVRARRAGGERGGGGATVLPSLLFPERALLVPSCSRPRCARSASQLSLVPRAAAMDAQSVTSRRPPSRPGDVSVMKGEIARCLPGVHSRKRPDGRASVHTPWGKRIPRKKRRRRVVRARSRSSVHFSSLSLLVLRARTLDSLALTHSFGVGWHTRAARSAGP